MDTGESGKMLLAINTSTPQFSIALLREDGSVLSEFSLSPASRNFRGVMPAIDYLFAESGVRARDLAAVAIAKGPGSFTGLRVGLSTAKGLCQALNIPLIGVSGLEAMANQASHVSIPVCPIIASRKGEVFAALFRRSGEGRMSRLTEDAGFALETLDTLVEEETLIIGHDYPAQAHVLSGILGSKAIPAPAFLWILRASSVGAVGLRRFKDQDFDDLQDLVPAYLRPPDIRPNPYPLVSPESPSDPS